MVEQSRALVTVREVYSSNQALALKVFPSFNDSAHTSALLTWAKDGRGIKFVTNIECEVNDRRRQADLKGY